MSGTGVSFPSTLSWTTTALPSYRPPEDSAAATGTGGSRESVILHLLIRIALVTRQGIWLRS
jgi:hypothetical protein